VFEHRPVHREEELRDGTASVESDSEVLSRHLAGDPEAFVELVRRHGRYLFAVASRVVGRADAEDVVQTAIVNALRSADRFEGRAAVRTWLHRITVNEALDHLRRRRSGEVFQNPLEETVEPQSPEVGVDARVVGEELVDQLLDDLPLSTRQMVVLVDLLGYSVADAARVLGVAEGTVKSRRARAFERLARRIER
jgi:RNA polymerase sigma-70 factor, ECF subfamily